jgi:hypothetical protein
MKILMTLYGDETTWGDWQAFDDAARAAGVLSACDGLELAGNAAGRAFLERRLAES